MKVSRKKSNTKRVIAWLIIFLVVIMLIVGWFLYLQHKSNTSNTREASTTNKQTDLKSTDSTTPNQTNTKSNDSQSNGGATATNSTNNKTSVAVTVVNAAQYQSNVQVRAYASDISTSGVCTFTFSKTGYNSITQQTNGNVNSSTTSCSQLSIPVSDFPSAGLWSLVVTYSSDDAQGSSNPQSVEIN